MHERPSVCQSFLVEDEEENVTLFSLQTTRKRSRETNIPLFSLYIQEGGDAYVSLMYTSNLEYCTLFRVAWHQVINHATNRSELFTDLPVIEGTEGISRTSCTTHSTSCDCLCLSSHLSTSFWRCSSKCRERRKVQKIRWWALNEKHKTRGRHDLQFHFLLRKLSRPRRWGEKTSHLLHWRTPFTLLDLRLRPDYPGNPRRPRRNFHPDYKKLQDIPPKTRLKTLS